MSQPSWYFVNVSIKILHVVYTWKHACLKKLDYVKLLQVVDGHLLIDESKGTLFSYHD